MKKRLLVMATVCSICVLLAGCETEKNRLDQEVRRLCAKDGGVKVYETVKLPAEQFDQYGNPQFGRKGGIQIPSEKDMKESDEYYYVRKRAYIKGGDASEDYEARMWRTDHKIIRRSDGKVLGESVDYVRRGDGFPGPWHPSAFSCSDIKKDPDFEKAIFLKETEK